ncbi:MAG TPA: hypothetical protein VJK26_01750 [Patescibacteria group bacterium]|nr:hypothetical protein [Patescibacteria group bacterium]
MILPNPIIWGRPLNIWLGFLALGLLILQILIGARILKLPFWVHTRVVWILLLIVVLIHAYYGIQISFLK